MEELIRLINKEFNPRIKLDDDDIEDLREAIELFLCDGINDLRLDIEDLKEEIEELRDYNRELLGELYGR